VRTVNLKLILANGFPWTWTPIFVTITQSVMKEQSKTVSLENQDVLFEEFNSLFKILKHKPYKKVSIYFKKNYEINDLNQSQ